MKELKQAGFLFLWVTILTGFLYPLGITWIGQRFFSHQANGSLMTRRDRVVGSELIGQEWKSPRYFHGRPSASHYDAANSSAGNYGPTNAKWLAEVTARIQQERKLESLGENIPIPPDLALASASGLDPHISLQAALLQIPRIARARSLGEKELRGLVNRHIEAPWLGLWGQTRVNVLKLNLDLDEPSAFREMSQ